MAMKSERSQLLLNDDQLQGARKPLQEVRKLLDAYFIDLTVEEASGRTMAEGREGYARLVSKIASAHEESLSRKDNADDLVQRLDFDARLETLRQELLALMETVTDTQRANGILAMRLTDRYVGSLQNDRGNISALDMAMSEVDDWNKRFGSWAGRKPETPDTNPAE